MANGIGRCCLCSRDHSHLCRAHIIPSAFVQIAAGRTKAGSHKAQDADLTTLRADKATAYPGAARAFQYDPNIICAVCDGEILGRYDEALVQFCKDWIENSCDPSKITSGEIDFPLASIETSRDLFLAVAAVIWRAGVSSRFPNVKLGKYSEMLRQWLHSGCLPAEPERFFAVSVEAYPLENFGIVGLDQLRLAASPEILRHKLPGGTYYELFLPSLYIAIRVGQGDGRVFEPHRLWRAREAKVPITVKQYAGSRHASITAGIHQRVTAQSAPR